MLQTAEVMRMAARRFLLSILAGCALSVSALANLELNPTAPQQYTVRSGDTLWDISAQFLNEPWRWREIWQGNPQIKNPDLIYPGDILELVFVDGRPVIRVASSGRRVVKLSPRIRQGPARSGAVPTIPIDAITHFLSRPLVVEEKELERAPYIVSMGAEHLIGGPGTKVYARGIKNEIPVYSVLRRGEAYVDPDDPDETVLGYEAIYVADAALEALGDPATLRLLRSKREVLIGDRLLPAEDEGSQGSYMPHPPPQPVTGKIISVLEGVRLIGQFQIVVMNLGKEDGLDSGSVLNVFNRGEVIIDELARDPNPTMPEPDAQIELDSERQRGIDGLTIVLDRFARDVVDLFAEKDESYKEVLLPERQAGTVMVFRTFDKLSYAIVLDGTRPIRVRDAVRSPPT